MRGRDGEPVEDEPEERELHPCDGSGWLPDGERHGRPVAVPCPQCKPWAAERRPPTREEREWAAQQR